VFGEGVGGYSIPQAFGSVKVGFLEKAGKRLRRSFGFSGREEREGGGFWRVLCVEYTRCPACLGPCMIHVITCFHGSTGTLENWKTLESTETVHRTNDNRTNRIPTHFKIMPFESKRWPIENGYAASSAARF